MQIFDYSFFVLRPDGPRHRNAIASGIISLRSITPAKIAYAVTGNLFLYGTLFSVWLLTESSPSGCPAENLMAEDGGWRMEVGGRRAEDGGRRAEDGDLTKQRGKEIELVEMETPLGVK